MSKYLDIHISELQMRRRAWARVNKTPITAPYIQKGMVLC